VRQVVVVGLCLILLILNVDSLGISDQVTPSLGHVLLNVIVAEIVCIDEEAQSRVLVQRRLGG